MEVFLLLINESMLIYVYIPWFGIQFIQFSLLAVFLLESIEFPNHRMSLIKPSIRS